MPGCVELRYDPHAAATGVLHDARDVFWLVREKAATAGGRSGGGGGGGGGEGGGGGAVSNERVGGIGAALGERRDRSADEGERLCVDDVPVQHIQLAVGHRVDRTEEVAHGQPVPRRVDQHPSVCVLWAVFNGHKREREAAPAPRARAARSGVSRECGGCELGEGRHCVYRAPHTTRRNADPARATFSRAVPALDGELVALVAVDRGVAGRERAM